MRYLCLIPLLWQLPVHAEQIDLVAKGREAFQVWGCAECHVSTKDDQSIKSGPSLYNLFQNTPRKREVLNAKEEKITIDADKAYFLQSVRKPAEHRAIAESGPTSGTAYPAIMPLFAPELVTDAHVDAIWHFLRHAADEGKNGPASVMGDFPAEKAKSPFENPAEIIVATQPRIIRAPLMHASGRAIHVGLPNGRNYSFDPRFLSLRSIWNGGFLNLVKEQTGRSTPGSDRGHLAKDVVDATPALVPVAANGNALDLEFKEPDVLDDNAAIKHLEKGGNFLEELASWECDFHGYQLDDKGNPTFLFRIGGNELTQRILFDETGDLICEISGNLRTPQAFIVRESFRKIAKVEGGELKDDRWILPAGNGKTYRLRVPLPVGLSAREPVPTKENSAPQALKKVPAQAELPPGYALETWEAPTDLFGRKQLFEPTAIAVAKNGTIVVGTRTAGIWRIKNNQWQLFAEGTYECLGLVIEDDQGDKIVIAQKPELTRISDNNGDGRADRFQTVCDDYGFHGNYHEYTHGPVRDAEGNYYFTLNLCHNNNTQASYKAGGNFMGSMGGFRGWACRVTPEGKFEPYANGLRSPAGLGIDPTGRLLYIDNQGEYFGSSKISFLVKDHFYGHPSGLVSLPGMKPTSPEIAFSEWKEKTHPCALWFPHNKYANSPGNPAWDLTKGRFGPFGGQMFVGDQTLSTLLRVETETVDGHDQGTMVLFARKLASGVMRPCFLPDGSLLLGQTGRGWQSNGGNVASLQHITWDGKTKAATVHSIKSDSTGFRVNFTSPLLAGSSAESLLADCKLLSWTYSDSQQYGSRENEKWESRITKVTIAPDRLSVILEIPDVAMPEKLINRIHQFTLANAAKHFATPAQPTLEAYQTVRALKK